MGEGGKKRVNPAHDATLDREVAFALIKSEGLDEVSRTRIQREAQGMGRLGSHPHIVTVFDLGEHDGQRYRKSIRPPASPKAIKVAQETCPGLEFAYSRGIVHRDSKPRNVWLIEDGAAKIGDFGLAAVLDDPGSPRKE